MTAKIYLLFIKIRIALKKAGDYLPLDLAHSQIRTTLRSCKVSNLEVQRGYHRSIEKVKQRHGL